MNEKVAVLIPARIQSTRYPGKPLAQLQGKPMILHVIDRCRSAVVNSNIFVATDSREILSIVQEYGANGVLTSDHQTGTDRVAEAIDKIAAEFIINVQGDEPCFNPQDIMKSIKFLIESKYDVMTGYCEILDSREFNDPNTIKITVGNQDQLLYISRAPIPGSKRNVFESAFRQVCIYGYSREMLIKFAGLKRSTLELIEDHELLRFLENGITVGATKLSNWSVPVDFETDIFEAEEVLKQKFSTFSTINTENSL